MVERDVAETVRVTDRPKKLKPLHRISRVVDTASCNIPNADHDQERGDEDAFVVRHLVETLLRVEVASAY